MRPMSLIAACVLGLPSTTLAQRAVTDSVLRKGEWGAEVVLGPSITGASVLRFLSSRTALVVGANASVSHSKHEIDDGFSFPDQSSTQSNIDGRLGLRRYHSSAREHLHPLVGVGVRSIYTKLAADSHAWTAGGYGELGAIYFFTPHLSLGATGEVSALYSKTTQRANNTKATSTSTAVNASLVRVLASVYF